MDSPIPSPAELAARLPRSARAAQTVERGRAALRDALHGRDRRFVAIVGPCSLHDPRAALEYAERLAKLAAELGDALVAGHAHLLREAAQRARLEGTDQRSAASTGAATSRSASRARASCSAR